MHYHMKYVHTDALYTICSECWYSRYNGCIPVCIMFNKYLKVFQRCFDDRKRIYNAKCGQIWVCCTFGKIEKYSKKFVTFWPKMLGDRGGGALVSGDFFFRSVTWVGAPKFPFEVLHNKWTAPNDILACGIYTVYCMWCVQVWSL